MKARGIAITNAIIETFVRDVYFSIELIAIPSASVITRKNQSRIIIFHLYFMRMKISAKANMKANTIDRKFAVGSSDGVSSPKGSDLSVIIISCSPVCGFTIV